MRCGIYMNNYFPLHTKKRTAICPEEAEHRSRNDNGSLLFFSTPDIPCRFMYLPVYLLLVAVTIKYLFTFGNVECNCTRLNIYEIKFRLKYVENIQISRMCVCFFLSFVN